MKFVVGVDGEESFRATVEQLDLKGGDVIIVQVDDVGGPSAGDKMNQALASIGPCKRSGPTGTS